MENYVLVVDDNPDSQEILTRILVSLGLEVKVAGDGEEAIAQIGRELPALILLDLMMPRMNGFAVLSFLRKKPDTRRIPVVVVSAYVDPLAMSRLPGVAHVILKPGYSIAEVQSAVMKLLGKVS